MSPRNSPASLTSGFLEALSADGPDPELADELRLYGQFVGSWDFDWRGLDKSGRWQTAVGEWHFGWVLEGRAVQDVWMVPADPERRRLGTHSFEYGTTIRFFDTELGAWRVTWIGPVNGNVRRFEAREERDEIVQWSMDDDRRWIFSDVTPDSFRWRGEISNDRGKTWDLDEEMHLRRRGTRNAAAR